MKTKTTNTEKELTKHLKALAKEYQSDWEDVPEWVIKASVDFFDSKQPTKEQKKLETAGRFLSCSSDKELKKMVKLIEGHENEGELIDNIDGVDVAEKFEYSFTVKTFLEEINY